MTPDHHHKTRTLWLTGVLHGFTHLYQVALMPLYLLIQKDFGFPSVAQATLLMTVMLAACYAPSYPIGMLADRMNRKRLLGFGLALNGLGFVGLGLAPNFAWALVAVTVAGFGGSFYHPAATAMIARLFPNGTGKALGLAGIGASLGFFAGPVYAGWRAEGLEAMLGPAAWRRPVIELGLLGVVAAALFLWLAGDEQPAPEAHRKAIPHGKLFPTPALWFFFLAYCIAFSLRDFAGASMGSLGSLFLQHARGFDPKWTGLMLSGMFLPSAISNPLFGSLSDRGRKRWITTALVMAALMVALFPRVPPGWTIGVLVVFGFFFMASYPMTEAALMASVPDAVRGRVFGIFVTGAGVLGNLSHWAVGAWVKSLRAEAQSAGAYVNVYGLLALLVLLSLAGLLCLRPLQAGRPPVAPEAVGVPQI
jgi:MFS family permease